MVIFDLRASPGVLNQVEDLDHVNLEPSLGSFQELFATQSAPPINSLCSSDEIQQSESPLGSTSVEPASVDLQSDSSLSSAVPTPFNFQPLRPKLQDGQKEQTTFNDTAPSMHLCPFASCGKTFDHPFKLRRHEKQHTRPELCEFCGRGFASRKDLDRHRMVCDTNSTPTLYFCSSTDCNRSIEGFLRKDNLLRHMRNHYPQSVTAEDSGA